MTLKKYGRLTFNKEAESLTDKSGRKVRIFECICECGTKKTYRLSNLSSGHTKSCGCLKREKSKERSLKHGMSGTNVYLLWKAMINRCYLKSSQKYHRYGGRGIKVCKRWHDFEMFYGDMGVKPKNKSLGRIDNDGNYSPENCRWETPKQQARNTSQNRIITFKGQKKCLIEWAEIFGLKPNTLSARILVHGWSVEKALTTPVMDSKYKPKQQAEV